MVKPPPTDASSEKRRDTRVSVELTAHCQIGHAFHRLPVSDLSRGGLRLETAEHHQEGTPVRVALAVPSPVEEAGLHFCTLSGQVAHNAVDPRGRPLGVGVRFVEADRGDSDLEALRAYLRSLGA